MFDFLKRHRKKSAEEKKRAMVFVDFEHWYISLDKLFHQKPDVKAFRHELAEKYDIIDIAFFGDFSNPSLRGEIHNIRMVSNKIIETQNSSPNFEKDFTDFIILDHIYQSALSAEANKIDAYVIFTGDGHFSSAVSFLVNKCHKEVGIYAVKNAVSSQLSSCATFTRLIPDFKPADKKYERMILKNLKALYDKNRGKKVYPTFYATIEATAKYNKVKREKIEEALRGLMRDGYIYQNKQVVKDNESIKVLYVNWKAVTRDGLL
ncbi:MAG: NYN domain-containing protein [Ruminococcaceae bacterium]|nr:NYN domain-containing protein [Oscillospiraceae bacterium]